MTQKLAIDIKSFNIDYPFIIDYQYMFVIGWINYYIIVKATGWFLSKKIWTKKKSLFNPEERLFSVTKRPYQFGTYATTYKVTSIGSYLGEKTVWVWSLPPPSPCSFNDSVPKYNDIFTLIYLWDTNFSRHLSYLTWSLLVWYKIVSTLQRRRRTFWRRRWAVKR